MKEQILEGESAEKVLLEDDTGRAACYVRYLDRMQTIHDRKTHGSKMRSITTHYLWGAPGIGKTWHIYVPTRLRIFTE